MYLPDSTREPVEIQTSNRHGSDKWIVAAMLLLAALVAPVSLLWHAIPWWGWVGALPLGMAAAVVATLPSTGRENYRLVGDEIEIARGGQVRRISARDVAALSAPTDMPMRSALKLASGEVVVLSHPELWGSTAYPVPRVLANWIRHHGGGRGGETPKAWQAPTPPDPPLKRLALSWPGFLVLVFGTWLCLVLAWSAAMGHDRPDFSKGWMFPGVMVGSRWAANRGQNKEWTRDPASW